MDTYRKRHSVVGVNEVPQRSLKEPEYSKSRSLSITTTGIDTAEFPQIQDSREDIKYPSHDTPQIFGQYTLQTQPEEKTYWFSHLLRPAQYIWYSHWKMYIFFVIGIGFAIAHHLFYRHLDGQIVRGNAQQRMLRHGTVLAFAAKASLVSAVLSAYREQTWVTIRSRFLRVSTLDDMFSAPETPFSLLNREFISRAKIAALLSLYGWISPLIVILSTNTLIVKSTMEVQQSLCPGIRTLNFTHKSVHIWNNNTIDNIRNFPVIAVRGTAFSMEPGDFDYFTGLSSSAKEVFTTTTYLRRPLTDRNATLEVCERGWNCTVQVEFTGPAYKCQELARGVGAQPKSLIQESGEAKPPFTLDSLVPTGNLTYHAITWRGEYAEEQFLDLNESKVPSSRPPYPKNAGALRTEPVIWIGYSERADPSIPPVVVDESGNASFNEKAWTPVMIACEHQEAILTAEFVFKDGRQFNSITNRTFRGPIINTTFIPNVLSNDGTPDNTTAEPQDNYILPTDPEYRLTATYHALGMFLRDMIRDDIEAVAYRDTKQYSAFPKRKVGQTSLVDPKTSGDLLPNLTANLETYYDSLILSLLAEPRFLPVSWARKPAEKTGALRYNGTGPLEDYLYPCTRSRPGNMFDYRARLLLLVYTVAIFLALLGIMVGAYAIRKNGGLSGSTRFSNIVAVTRGPALSKLDWLESEGDTVRVSRDVKRMRLGYGRLKMTESEKAEMSEKLDMRPEDYKLGFGFEGEVDQRRGSKISLDHVA